MKRGGRLARDRARVEGSISVDFFYDYDGLAEKRALIVIDLLT